MKSDAVERRLTAILSADVAGYSRLMADDDEATLHSLEACRIIFRDCISPRQGRVVDSPGDALLAEFPAVTNAVLCAVEIQEALAKYNDPQPEHRRMRFRIGVNVGEVLVRQGALFGDGVNIAARLEALAPIGGICVSGTVFDQVKGRVPLSFEYLGEKKVKNIPTPVRTYRIAVGGEDTAKSGAPLSIAGFGIPAPTDRPTIAVLPFRNLGGDSDQDYFGDGISEDLITELSKLSGLFVIARNSAFVFKGQAVSAREVGRKLGVGYILEGSVRKAGERVRINAQLIDVESDRHLWAERFDRTLEDIFAVQDEITEEIVTALDVKLVAGERARLWRASLRNPEARSALYRGYEQFYLLSKAGNAEAKVLFERVIELEPESPMGYVGAAGPRWVEVLRGWSGAPNETMAEAAKLAEKALELDHDDPMAHSLLGVFAVMRGDYEEALICVRRAVDLSPNHSDVLFMAGLVMALDGQNEEAIHTLGRALSHNPVRPVVYVNLLGVAYREMGRYREAVEILKEIIAREPDYVPGRCALISVYAALGQYDEVHVEVEEIKRRIPEFALEGYYRLLPFR
ncbi:MAG: adenylate/guanylate cyclase domain-containing protein, partial [bacterium]